MASRQQNVPAGGPTYTIKVVGHRPTPLRDLYHALLLAPWSVAFGVIALGYLAVNALFACAYLALGGVANARPGSCVDAFYFSVQTMGTIGYGSMYPASHAANVVVGGESIAGLLITSLAAGLVFAKFSRPTARVVFSRRATISRMDGEPTLQFRVSNQRGNQTVDALFRVVLVRTEQTLEGTTLFRSRDLVLRRERALSLSRSWSSSHVIDASSPLFGETPESLVARDAELQVLVVGLDDTTMQTVHALHRYDATDLLFGHRHVDVLSEDGEGNVLLDLRKFHDTTPEAPR